MIYSFSRLLFIVLIFSSCTTQRGATKYFNDHPLVSADYCAARYPVGETTDTKAYDRTAAIVDSLVEEYKGLREATDTDRQQLIEQIRSLSYSRPECDTIVRTVERTVFKDKIVYKAADKAVEAAKKVAPVIEMKVNSAQVEAMRLRFNECADAGLALSRDNDALRDRMKGKILIPWWISVVFGGYAAVSIWRKSINPIKWLV